MLISAALHGCADEGPHTSLPTPDRPISDILDVATLDRAFEPSAAAHGPYDAEACEPPTDDGPCSLLCDPDALIENYVPEGTCVHFLCTMRDGTQRNVGACHWP